MNFDSLHRDHPAYDICHNCYSLRSSLNINHSLKQSHVRIIVLCLVGNFNHNLWNRLILTNPIAQHSINIIPRFPFTVTIWMYFALKCPYKRQFCLGQITLMLLNAQEFSKWERISCENEFCRNATVLIHELTICVVCPEYDLLNCYWYFPLFPSIWKAYEAG